jgi:hypothetical protein
VVSRGFDVSKRPVALQLDFGCRQLPEWPSRSPHNERSRRNERARRDNRTCSDEGILSHDRTVENDRSDSDQGSISDLAAVYDGAMTDCDLVSERGGKTVR